MNQLTQKRLLELLSYDPVGGRFAWRDQERASKPVGHQHHGYLKISIPGFGGLYAHRLAWLYMTGEWPERFVDHADCNRLNNAWKNLRLATRQQNAANSVRQRRNVANAKGVTKRRDGYRAFIKVGERNIHLGDYNTVEEAAAAYAGAAKVAFGEYSRLSE